MVQEGCVLLSLTVALDVVPNLDRLGALCSEICAQSASCPNLWLAQSGANQVLRPGRPHTGIRIVQLRGHGLKIMRRHDGGIVGATAQEGSPNISYSMLFGVVSVHIGS